MWKYILIFAVIVAAFGCDDRTTNPDTDIWSRLQVTFNDTVFYEETLDAGDLASTAYLLLPNNEQLTLEKYYFATELEREIDDVVIDYRVIAKKDGFYSTYHACGRQDTITVNASTGFATVDPGLVCGSILDIFYGPLSLEEVYVLQDSVIVDSLTTTANGYFAHDLVLGDYQMVIKDFYPGGEWYEFNVDSYYDDYYIEFDLDR